MTRFLFAMLLSTGLTSAARAQSLPARPQPFTFVTDQAQLLAPADAQKLDAGLRRYADQNGTQVIVVTVPSLGGRPVADYARALGNEWGVGQRGKNNGVVVLLSGQEHKVTIQAGEGLQSAITPAVTSRIINQQMLPSFKQGNYFAGLRTGLNTLLLAANPASDPRRTAPAGTAPASAGSDNFPALGGAGAAPATANADAYEAPASTPEPSYSAPPAEPTGSGMTMGMMLLIGLAVAGVGFLLLRMLRRKSSAPTGGNAPDFYGNQPNRPNGGNYNNGPGYQPGSSGPGLGGMLATGAAAAAGAYLGNRMASGNDSGSSSSFDNSGSVAGLGAGAAAGSAGADSGPDYFSDTNTGSAASADYFSDDNNSSGSSDFSADDMGGGGFDGGDDNSGSW